MLLKRRVLIATAILFIGCLATLSWAEDTLLDRLTSPDFRSRQRALGELRALDQKDRQPLIPGLIQVLKEGDKNSREGAGDALAAIGAPVVPQLLKALNSGDTAQCKLVIKTLGDMGQDGQAAVPKLVRLYNRSTDKETRYFIVAAWGGIGPWASEAFSVIRDALNSDDATMRQIATHTLGQMGVNGAEALPDLVRAMAEDQDYSLRLSAVKAVGNMGRRAAGSVGVLTHIVKNDDDKLEIKDAAYYSLKNIGTPEALDASEWYRREVIKDTHMPDAFKKVLNANDE